MPYLHGIGKQLPKLVIKTARTHCLSKRPAVAWHQNYPQCTSSGFSAKEAEAALSFFGHEFVGGERAPEMGLENHALLRDAVALDYLKFIEAQSVSEPRFSASWQRFVGSYNFGRTFSSRLSSVAMVMANLIQARPLFDRQVVTEYPQVYFYRGQASSLLQNDPYFGSLFFCKDYPNPLAKIFGSFNDSDGTINILDIGCVFQGATGSPTLNFFSDILSYLFSNQKFRFFGIDACCQGQLFPVIRGDELFLEDIYQFGPDGISLNPIFSQQQKLFLNYRLNHHFNFDNPDFALPEGLQVDFATCSMVIGLYLAIKYDLPLAQQTSKGCYQIYLETKKAQIKKAAEKKVNLEQETDRMIRNILRVLKPKGLLFISPSFPFFGARNDCFEIYQAEQINDSLLIPRATMTFYPDLDCQQRYLEQILGRFPQHCSDENFRKQLGQALFLSSKRPNLFRDSVWGRVEEIIASESNLSRQQILEIILRGVTV